MAKLIFVFLFPVYLFAQGVSINTTSSPPHSSAILDISDTSKGVYLPRLTTAQRNAISNPQAGLVIFNSEVLFFEYYDGTNWNTVSPSSSLIAGNGILIQNDTISVNYTQNTGLPSGRNMHLYSIANSPPTGTRDIDTLYLQPGNIITVEVSGMHSGTGRGRLQIIQNGSPLTGIAHSTSFNEYRQSCGDSQIRFCTGTGMSNSSELGLSYSGCGGCPLTGYGYNRTLSVEITNSSPVIIQYNSYTSPLNFNLKVTVY